jgi:hypothetical protein
MRACRFLMVILLLQICSPSLHSQQSYLRIKTSDGQGALIPLYGIQKITFSQVTGMTEMGPSAAVARSLLLLQNYPNPFNPSTSICYELPHSGDVEVTVYSLQGQIIANVEKAFREAGSHEARWDGRDHGGKSVASGVYFYQVRFDQSIVTRKMLLLK